MKILPSAFFLTVLACSGAAWATDPPPRAGAARPVATPEQVKPEIEKEEQAKALAPKAEQAKAEPAKAEQAKAEQAKAEQAKAARKMPRRRAVYQQLDQIPLRASPPPAYAPHLSPPTAAPRIHGVPAPAPAAVNCVGTACTDASGASYQGGVGTSLIGPQGRLCNNNGITVQCF